MKASLTARTLAVAGFTLLLLGAGQALAASRLQEFLPKAQPADVFPGADRLGTPQGDPPLVPAYGGDRLLGHVYLNSDLTNSVGYSGKPIHILVGIDPQGVVRGMKLVGHKEPIILIGIPEKRVIDAINWLTMTGVAALGMVGGRAHDRCPVTARARAAP